PQQPDERDERDEEAGGDDDGREVVLEPAGGEPGAAGAQRRRCGGGGHAAISVRLTMDRAAALTTNVNTNSTRPAAMNGPGWANSASPPVAMRAAKVCPMPKTDGSNGAPEPAVRTTRVTAIVSPRARPRPSIAPLTTPARPNGRTAIRTISQRVAPRARAASMFGRGVRSNTSREIEVTMGSTMTAS